MHTAMPSRWCRIGISPGPPRVTSASITMMRIANRNSSAGAPTARDCPHQPAVRHARWRRGVLLNSASWRNVARLTIEHGADPLRRLEAFGKRHISSGPIYVTTYLRTTDIGHYVPLAHDLDLKTMAHDLMEAIPPCE
jgi:hypothetical protein